MIRKYLLPLLAISGVLFAVFVALAGVQPVPAAAPVADPAQPVFDSYIAGAGIIEPSTENIAIGTSVGEVVTDVFVRVGQNVHRGDRLFSLRTDVVESELLVRRSALEAAQAKLQRLRSLPRPEDIPPAEARLAEAEASLADVRSQLDFYEGVSDPRAISRDELNRRRNAVSVAQARVAEARAQLSLLKAGSWEQDIKVAQSEIASAEAMLKQTRTELARRTVLSPIDGRVLQVKLRAGEFAQPGSLATPLMLLGEVDRLFVRVDVDENDAWRVLPNSPAIAYVRGNSSLSTSLTFERIEPYIVPKKSLTGDSSERVDTRVLQVIFSFSREALPVYVGQQMDVFIQAPPVSQTTTRVGATTKANH